MRALALASLVLVAACGDDPPKKYTTYQACFDDVIKQDLTNVETIVKCCIDHEIGGMKGPVCGATDADCINFLTANLKQTDADITTQMQACTDYLAQKDM